MTSRRGAHLLQLAMTPTIAVADADRAAAFQHDLGGVRMGDDVQVGAAHGRAQKRARGADAAAVLDGALGVGDAFLDGAVVVRVAGDAEGGGALDEGLAERVAPVDVGDREVAFAAAVGGVAIAEAALHALEVGEHIGVAPAAIAELRPGIEVHALAAIVDVAVDGAGAAERLAARRGDASAAGPLARLHPVEPVHARVVVGLDETGRNMDEGVPVAGAGLQHQHGRRAVLAQPVGEHAAGRTRPDDDVVEGLHRASPMGFLARISARRGASRQGVEGAYACAVRAAISSGRAQDRSWQRLSGAPGAQLGLPLPARSLALARRRRPKEDPLDNHEDRQRRQ